jgi:hypothetical protein
MMKVKTSVSHKAVDVSASFFLSCFFFNQHENWRISVVGFLFIFVIYFFVEGGPKSKTDRGLEEGLSGSALMSNQL